MSPTSKPQEKAVPSTSTRRIDLKDVLGDGREVIICHGSEEYRLRLTSNDKLLLTK
jgi:hemin uptake protein HemP